MTELEASTEPTDTPALVEWLRQQITEDEQVALDAGGSRWKRELYDYVVEATDNGFIVCGEGRPSGGRADHIARHDPARVLREVAAKRKMLELHEYATAAWALGRDKLNPPTVHLGASTMTKAVLRVLAEIYEDRPGFNPAWRIDG
jgi:hypothetical protein